MMSIDNQIMNTPEFFACFVRDSHFCFFVWSHEIVSSVKIVDGMTPVLVKVKGCLGGSSVAFNDGANIVHIDNIVELNGNKHIVLENDLAQNNILALNIVVHMV